MMDKKVFMAMYDVKGIQNYVFKTNKIKEVIGASLIIDELIIDVFFDAVEDENKKIPGANDSFEFFDDTDLKYEIMYYGGGNLVVLFRKEKIEDVYYINQKMTKHIIEKSYGLSLACTVIEISDINHYQDDYQRLTKEMNFIKDNMVEVKPVGALPIVGSDPMTGYPLSKYKKNKKVSYETSLKLDKYKEYFEDCVSEKDNDLKQYINSLNTDTYGSEEGESLMAIVHIDGNSMGSSIKNIISKVQTYPEAVKAMRIISSNIKNTFEEKGLQAIEKHLEEFYEESEINKEKYQRRLFRTIVKAGDDITFICNARIALRCVETFIDAIKEERMYEGTDTFTACAGIAIVHTHFPFYVGYQIAEELCESAKEKAKANKENGKVGNYVDFHLCNSGVVSDLKTIRKQQYQNVNHFTLLKRPYNLNRDGKYSIQEFYDALNSFNSHLARSKSKELRDAYFESEDQVKYVVKRISSRDKKREIPAGDFFEDNNVAKYYDALEMLDLHWGGKQGETQD